MSAASGLVALGRAAEVLLLVYSLLSGSTLWPPQVCLPMLWVNAGRLVDDRFSGQSLHVRALLRSKSSREL